ncbi:MAG: hypothetical protein AAGK97_07155, partial [Bacteroidota bacterium]
MKKAIMLLAFFSIAVMAIAQNQNDYYWAGGEKIPVFKNENSFILIFKNQDKFKTAKQILKNDAVENIEILERNQFVIVQLKEQYNFDKNRFFEEMRLEEEDAIFHFGLELS